MLEKGQNWELFGYDVRRLGRYWIAAWRDLLWAHDSPVRHRLDEVVTVHGAGRASRQGGGIIAAVELLEPRQDTRIFMTRPFASQRPRDAQPLVSRDPRAGRRPATRMIAP